MYRFLFGSGFCFFHKKVESDNFVVYNNDKGVIFVKKGVIHMEKNTLLRNRPYLYLMAAQVVSNLGDWLSLMAIFSLMAFKWNASPLEISFVVICLGLPMTVLGPVSGVIADRMNRKVIMVVSDLFRCVILLGLIVATVPWHIYVLLFLLGSFSSLFTPAKSGMLKEIVNDEEMQQAASISSVIQDGTKIIGPAISGVLVTAAGLNSVFLLDSISFLVSALLLFMLPKTRTFGSKEKAEHPPMISDLKEGFLYIKKVPFILYGTGLMFVSMLILQMADAQFSVLIRLLKEGSPALVGLVVTCSGSGFLITGLCLAKYKVRSPWLAMTMGLFILGSGFVIVGYLAHIQLPHSFIWAPVITFLAASGGGFIFIPFNTAVQKLTPVHMTGRVFGLTGSMIMTATLIGPVAGGFAGNHWGVISVFIASGAGLVTISLTALLLRKRTERSDHLVTESAGPTQGTTPA